MKILEAMRRRNDIYEKKIVNIDLESLAQTYDGDSQSSI